MTLSHCRYQLPILPRQILSTLCLLTVTAIAPASGFASGETGVTPHPDTQEAKATPAPPGMESMTPEQQADLHMARKRYQAAIQAYSQLQPKTAEIWNKLGIANQQMLIMDEARRCYEASLKLNPKNPDVLNNLGSLYYNFKDYGLAERYYRKALKFSPKSSLIYKNLGTALLAEDKLKKGWECYQTAMKLDPLIFERTSQYKVGGPTPSQKRGAMNYFLAVSYLRIGNVDRAVDYLRMAIDQGYTDRKKVMGDKEFAVLRGQPAFEQLLIEQRAQ